MLERPTAQLWPGLQNNFGWARFHDLLCLQYQSERLKKSRSVYIYLGQWLSNSFFWEGIVFFTFLKTASKNKVKTGFSCKKLRTLTFKTAYMQKITEMREVCVQLCRLHSLQGSEGTFQMSTFSCSTVYDHNHIVVSSPGALQKLVFKYVCLLRRAASMCVCFFSHLCWEWFLYLQAFVFVGLLMCVCVCRHVFLMKVHAEQINSQKLRGGGSPSLWNGAYCSL